MKSQYPWYSNIHMAQLSMISLYLWYPHTYIVTLCLTWLSYQMVTHVTCGHTCHMWLHLSHVVTLIECCQTCHMRPTTKNFVRWLPTPVLKLLTDPSYTFLQVQQSPDNHTMLNHTTLSLAPNLPRIKWNVNKFALIIAQKSPDNHTIMVKFSTFTA